MKEYIEREAVCYQLAKQATIDGQPRAIRRATKIVSDFPAAPVREVKRGEWIKHEAYNGAAWGFWECSVCGDKNWTIKHNFCPNCGAKMEES